MKNITGERASVRMIMNMQKHLSQLIVFSLNFSVLDIKQRNSKNSNKLGLKSPKFSAQPPSLGVYFIIYTHTPKPRFRPRLPSHDLMYDLTS